MKSIAYRMQAGAGVSRLDPEKIIPSNGKPKISQFMASYEGVSVFVETKNSIVSPNHQNQRQTLKARIENIVMHLQDYRKLAEVARAICRIWDDFIWFEDPSRSVSSEIFPSRPRPMPGPNREREKGEVRRLSEAGRQDSVPF